MSEQEEMIDFSAFQNVDIRVGIIRSVERAEGVRIPAYKLMIDFGHDIGTKKSIAQATNYAGEELLNKQILAVVNLKPRQVGTHLSEVLTLGVPTEDRGTALVVPDMTAVVGGKLF